ncbi:hypothetical protein V1478_015727 [Vespula squamosa]|uniref:Uncharacterized protein n=1 Tax=Vespula squamosa TaxID=30214 RepID=A0ABD2A1N1_VESSQ
MQFGTKQSAARKYGYFLLGLRRPDEPRIWAIPARIAAAGEHISNLILFRISMIFVVIPWKNFSQSRFSLAKTERSTTMANKGRRKVGGNGKKGQKEENPATVISENEACSATKIFLMQTAL